MGKLFVFLDKLDELKIPYKIERNSHEHALMVLVFAPGQRWEVEFFNDDDETVEIEIFQSDGTIKDETELIRLWEISSDDTGLDEILNQKNEALE